MKFMTLSNSMQLLSFFRFELPCNRSPEENVIVSYIVGLIPVFLLYSLDIQGNNDWWILGEHHRNRMGNPGDDHYTNQGLIGF